MTQMSYSFSSLGDLGDGYGFRKVRGALRVTAFGVNAIVYPPAYEGFHHYHDTQDELYFVHQGTARVEVGGEERILGPGGFVRQGAGTGWSRAWTIGMFARLSDGARAYENLHAILARSTLDNLWDSHPPFQIDGNFDQALKLVRDVKERHPTQLALVNSVNPDRVEGQKTAAFEICDALGRAPDYHLIPVGNAGNISAYWRGYREYHRAGLAKELPKMVGFQAAGAAPIVEDRIITEPKTLATAIRIGNPASWGLAKEALADSQGWIDAVTDEEIVRGYRQLAREEGIFMEPASCATVAGLAKMVKAGRFEPGSTLVLTLTGHGLKDPDTALESATRPLSVPARLDAVLAQLGL